MDMKNGQPSDVAKSGGGLSRRAFLGMGAGALVAAGCATSAGTTSGQAATPAALAGWPGDAPFRVLCFNIFVGGSGQGRPLSETLNVIRQTESDVVCLQEAKGTERWLARELGFDYFTISDSVAFLSRFPITDAAYHGIAFTMPDQEPVWCFNVHLEAYPYGPYDLRDDPSLSEGDLIRVANETRGRQMQRVLLQARRFVENGDNVLLAGDFNEPSHLDWTARAAAAGMHFGRSVNWPTSRAVHELGFEDLFRHFRPDEVGDPGDTWTPMPDLNEVHDRIDMLYYTGPRLRPRSVKIVGEDATHADIVVQPYPSDHRAVLGEFEIIRS